MSPPSHPGPEPVPGPALGPPLPAAAPLKAAPFCRIRESGTAELAGKPGLPFQAWSLDLSLVLLPSVASEGRRLKTIRGLLWSRGQALSVTHKAGRAEPASPVAWGATSVRHQVPLRPTSCPALPSALLWGRHLKVKGNQNPCLPGLGWKPWQGVHVTGKRLNVAS